LIYVSTEMVNVVLDIKCIRLKYMLATIIYNMLIMLFIGFLALATITFTFSFIKQSSEKSTLEYIFY